MNKAFRQMQLHKGRDSVRNDISWAAKSEDKRMFSQARVAKTWIQGIKIK